MSGLPNSGTPSWRRHSHARGLGRRCGLRSRSIWPPQHPGYAAVRGAVGSQATREGGQAANRPRNVALKRPHDPMPVTYTNRKDVTYTLYRATTATGRARDVFARQPRGPVEVSPPGIPSARASTALSLWHTSVRRSSQAMRWLRWRRLSDATQRHLSTVSRLGEITSPSTSDSGPQADELAAIFGEVGLPAARLQDVVQPRARAAR